VTHQLPSGIWLFGKAPEKEERREDARPKWPGFGIEPRAKFRELACEWGTLRVYNRKTTLSRFSYYIRWIDSEHWAEACGKRSARVFLKTGEGEVYT
jgi:hypothetical protein